MRNTILAWLIFFAGLSIEIAIDYTLRNNDGNIRTGGINEPLWFVIQIALGTIFIWLLFLGSKPLNNKYKQFISVSLQGVAAFLLYLFIGLYYVVGTGIDSL